MYVWGCDVWLTSKAIYHKSYRDLQSFLVPTHQWKNLSIDFVTGLPLSVDWKGDNYDSILVIVNQLTKMVHYKPIKVTIDAPGLAEVILDMVVWHHGLPDSIVTDGSSFFTAKFWSYSVTSSALNRGSQLRSTFRQMVKPRGRIALWKPTFEFLLTLNRMTGQGFYQWPSLHTITPRMLALVIRLLSWTMATIVRCHTRKMLTSAPSLSRRTNYQRNSDSWWLFAEKISNMPYSLKNELTLKESNLGATLPAGKFG